VLQVLSNLVGNAIKLAPEGSAITIETRASDGGVCLSVSDSGPGIAEDVLPHLFDRYWKVKPGDSGGSGLGLYIAKGIVEAHGGRIWADTKPGAGSTFRFTLPAAPKGAVT
jgi:signal transduction histidine kinase